MYSNHDPFFVPPHELKDRSVSFGRRWMESVAPHEEAAGQREFLRRIISIRKFSILSGIIGILFLGLIARTAYLQIYRGAAFASRADRNRIRLIRIPALRGIITDRHGTVIAKNTARFALVVTPADIPKEPTERTRILAAIAEIADMPPETITELITTYERRSPSIVIKDNIPHDEMLSLGVQSSGIPGLQIETAPRREYPQKNVFSHILGYVGKLSTTEYEQRKTDGYHLNDSIGKSGVEASFESLLRGTDGIQKAEVDALGKIVGTLSTEEPREGAPITLALDAPLQETTRQALLESMKKNRAKAGIALAMTPDARIRALVSLPDFDANAFPEQNNAEITKLLEDTRKPLFNRSIAGAYPPGSTIKPLIAAAALAEGLIQEKSSFVSSGGIRIGEWLFPDWRQGGHGVTNVTKAIAQSVNTFFYIVGGGHNGFPGLGLNGITKYAKIFGLGQKTGVDLPGETAGFVPSEEWKKKAIGEPWYIGDTYHISIGQGFLLTTPIQMATITAAIANNGTIYQPTVLEQPQTDRIRATRIVSESALAVVQKGMRETVLTGSGRSLGSLAVTSAGKTGTAQRDNDARTLAWYVGYAPYEKPELIVTVMVEEGGEGYVAAAPVAKAMIQKYFGVQDLAPTTEPVVPPEAEEIPADTLPIPTEPNPTAPPLP